MPADDIIAFALRLADRLAALLTASRARTGPFGDDGLLYAACHAVARGQAWFEASMRWPAMFDDADADPDTSWCESLLYLPREAWSQATGAGEDDFPVWTLEEGLAPFAGKLPASTAGDAVRRPATSPTAYTVYASFEQHPGIARHVEPEENVRVTLAGLLDDYSGACWIWTTIWASSTNRGRASRSCMTPARTCTGPKCRARPTRPPMARNSRAKPCWTCCTGCP